MSEVSEVSEVNEERKEISPQNRTFDEEENERSFGKSIIFESKSPTATQVPFYREVMLNDAAESISSINSISSDVGEQTPSQSASEVNNADSSRELGTELSRQKRTPGTEAVERFISKSSIDFKIKNPATGKINSSVEARVNRAALNLGDSAKFKPTPRTEGLENVSNLQNQVIRPFSKSEGPFETRKVLLTGLQSPDMEMVTVTETEVGDNHSKPLSNENETLLQSKMTNPVDTYQEFVNIDTAEGGKLIYKCSNKLNSPNSSETTSAEAKMPRSEKPSTDRQTIIGNSMLGLPPNADKLNVAGTNSNNEISEQVNPSFELTPTPLVENRENARLQKSPSNTRNPVSETAPVSVSATGQVTELPQHTVLQNHRINNASQLEYIKTDTMESGGLSNSSSQLPSFSRSNSKQPEPGINIENHSQIETIREVMTETPPQPAPTFNTAAELHDHFLNERLNKYSSQIKAHDVAYTHQHELQSEANRVPAKSPLIHDEQVLNSWKIEPEDFHVQHSIETEKPLPIGREKSGIPIGIIQNESANARNTLNKESFQMPFTENVCNESESSNNPSQYRNVTNAKFREQEFSGLKNDTTSSSLICARIDNEETLRAEANGAKKGNSEVSTSTPTQKVSKMVKPLGSISGKKSGSTYLDFSTAPDSNTIKMVDRQFTPEQSFSTNSKSSQPTSNIELEAQKFPNDDEAVPANTFHSTTSAKKVLTNTPGFVETIPQQTRVKPLGELTVPSYLKGQLPLELLSSQTDKRSLVTARDSPSRNIPPTSEVHIGQVDVIVVAPEPAVTHGNTGKRGTFNAQRSSRIDDIASRCYLRRL